MRKGEAGLGSTGVHVLRVALPVLAFAMVLALTGCGGQDLGPENASGSDEPTRSSAEDAAGGANAGGANGSTPEQGTCRAGTTPDEETAARVAAATERAMEENHLKAALVRVTKDGKEVATLARGESMTGVPATEAMHFRNGAVAISYLGTVLL